MFLSCESDKWGNSCVTMSALTRVSKTFVLYVLSTEAEVYCPSLIMLNLRRPILTSLHKFIKDKLLCKETEMNLLTIWLSLSLCAFCGWHNGGLHNLHYETWCLILDISFIYGDIHFTAGHVMIDRKYKWLMENTCIKLHTPIVHRFIPNYSHEDVMILKCLQHYWPWVWEI